MMEILSVGNDRGKKKLLHQELERYGVIFEGDEALKAPEYTLERLASGEASSCCGSLFFSLCWLIRRAEVHDQRKMSLNSRTAAQ
jgi:hypothetical protein